MQIDWPNSSLSNRLLLTWREILSHSPILCVLIQFSGPNKHLANLLDAVSSISISAASSAVHFVIITDDYEFEEIGISDPDLRDRSHSVEVRFSSESWAVSTNRFLNEWGWASEWYLFSHDDVLLETSDFFTRTLASLGDDFSKLGWVTFTSIGWYKLGKAISNSVRPGFFLDRHKFPRMFEASERFGTDPLSSWRSNLPEVPVWAHAPYSHLNLIHRSALLDIGNFPEWSPYTILLDEDMGLRALAANRANVWVPFVHYVHPNRPKSRMVPGIRNAFEADAHFHRIWGIREPYLDRDIDEIQRRHPNSLVAWTVGRESTDWRLW